jgi:hypothetical protein
MHEPFRKKRYEFQSAEVSFKGYVIISLRNLKGYVNVFLNSSQQAFLAAGLLNGGGYSWPRHKCQKLTSSFPFINVKGLHHFVL